MAAVETDAALLDSICVPDPNATPKYEIMSDAIIWSDEYHPEFTTELTWALRPIWNFRTRCILQGKRIESDVIDKCLKLFPHWIGFLSERWNQTPELLAEYRRGDITTRWCFRNLERECEKEIDNNARDTKGSID